MAVLGCFPGTPSQGLWVPGRSCPWQLFRTSEFRVGQQRLANGAPAYAALQYKFDVICAPHYKKHCDENGSLTSRVEPESRRIKTKGHPMYRFDDLQNFGKQFEAVTTSTSSLAKFWQSVAAESTEYSKTSFETGSAFLEKLAGAKPFEQTLQIQSEYLKTSYDGLVGYLTKVGELYSNAAKEAFKPIEAAVSKIQNFKA
jgi:Phasin protein